MRAATGRFVWFDLLTPDVNAAKAFYAEVAGWKTQQWAGGDGELLMRGEHRLGMVSRPQQGEPPRWLGYVAVEDVEGTVRRAQSLKGQVRVGATDVPGAGRYAVLADPQGATIGVYRSHEDRPAPDLSALGTFAWAELNTTAWKSAWGFYSELFGWKPTRSMSMGPELGDYFMFGTDKETSIGGMSDSANMMKQPAHWLYYVNVKSADESAKRVTALGGRVLNGPMDIPDGGRIAQCMDPQGVAFALSSR